MPSVKGLTVAFFEEKSTGGEALRVSAHVNPTCGTQQRHRQARHVSCIAYLVKTYLQAVKEVLVNGPLLEAPAEANDWDGRSVGETERSRIATQEHPHRHHRQYP